MNFRILFFLAIMVTWVNLPGIAQTVAEKPSSILVKFKGESDYQSLINNHKRRFGNRSEITAVAPRKDIYKFTFQSQNELESTKELLE